MFTGLIADRGVVRSVEDTTGGVVLEVTSTLTSELGAGDSIAVNGVCLTASDVGSEEFAAQVMAETLERSSLGALADGARVNLELPLRASDRLGGHFVQGHIDGTGTVVEVREEGFARVLTIETDAGLERYLVGKGSVAVDGVSLTVSAIGERGFSVSLIPETLTRTTLGALGEGAVVNLEVDILAKHLERLVDARGLPLGDALRP
jgi:riboflavin synthase